MDSCESAIFVLYHWPARFKPVGFTRKAFEAKASFIVRTCGCRTEFDSEAPMFGTLRAEQHYLHARRRFPVFPHDLSFNIANLVFIRQSKLQTFDLFSQF